MIRIVKPAAPPEVLLARGATERATICRLFSRFEADYKSGAKRFSFSSSIYGHKTVKAALSAAQHGKCFLCEAKFEHVAYGDIEHFRPKGGYMQDEHDTLHAPGYYWLAYDWDNLFLSCQICNQQYKKNFFPLRTPSARAASHKADITAEKPLLINPATDDPQRFISFRAEMPYAVRNSRRGRATIRRSGLDREPIESPPLRALYGVETHAHNRPSLRRSSPGFESRYSRRAEGACRSSQRDGRVCEHGASRHRCAFHHRVKAEDKAYKFYETDGT